ncbi:hypothetical protein GHK86_20240 [Acidimicrobiaceae bacterium USS-CC1]|uniref:SRPBCC family protein n=1 Tax=Acidiferrimicrobium australe TaxID=2664430 RepID=A0ABW9QZR2_9ACTN|nr:hypothetical protein [Acidiferrimicrobium australe]
MSDERPWAPPGEHVAVRRHWTYAPPPWVLYEAVVGEADRWLRPLAGERAPVVAAHRRPDWILLRPWITDAVGAVELEVEPDGLGSRLTVRAYADLPVLEEESRRRVRHRLGTIFGAGLREWVDEPHP